MKENQQVSEMTEAQVIAQLATLPDSAIDQACSGMQSAIVRARVNLIRQQSATALTPEDAAAIIRGNPEGITIHHRPKSGSIQCWGKCGRTIAANKVFCRDCQEKHDADANSLAEQAAAALTGQAEPDGVGVPGVGVKSMPAEGESSPGGFQN